MAFTKKLREAEPSELSVRLQQIVRGMPSPAVFFKMRNEMFCFARALACIVCLASFVWVFKLPNYRGGPKPAERAKTDPATKRNCHHNRLLGSPLKWGPRPSWAEHFHLRYQCGPKRESECGQSSTYIVKSVKCEVKMKSDADLLHQQSNSNNNNNSLWLALHRGETYTFSNDDLKNKYKSYKDLLE